MEIQTCAKIPKQRNEDAPICRKKTQMAKKENAAPMSAEETKKSVPKLIEGGWYFDGSEIFRRWIVLYERTPSMNVLSKAFRGGWSHTPQAPL